MTDLIRPSTVEYDNSVTMKYYSPKALDKPDDYYSYRPFTIAELEDVLHHARLNDAEDDTLVNLDTYRRHTEVQIVLPKHWADVSTPPVGRYRPTTNRFWSGFLCASILVGLVALFVVAGFADYYKIGY